MAIYTIIRNISLAGLLILSLQSCISRLSRPEITGVIVDYNKHPIANCKVGETVTAKDGTFTLKEQRYHAFFLTEMFQMEAPPLFVSEQIVMGGYEPDEISMFSSFGGGQGKGAKYKIDTVYLRKINEIIDVAGLLKDQKWLLGYAANTDTIYMVKEGYKEHCITQRCEEFYQEYNRLTENYYQSSDAGGLPEGILERQIKLVFNNNHAADLQLKERYYERDKEKKSKEDSILTGDLNYVLKNNHSILLKVKKIPALNGVFAIQKADMFQLMLIRKI